VRRKKHVTCNTTNCHYFGSSEWFRKARVVEDLAHDVAHDSVHDVAQGELLKQAIIHYINRKQVWNKLKTECCKPHCKMPI